MEVVTGLVDLLKRCLLVVEYTFFRDKQTSFCSCCIQRVRSFEMFSKLVSFLTSVLGRIFESILLWVLLFLSRCSWISCNLGEKSGIMLEGAVPCGFSKGNEFMSWNSDFKSNIRLHSKKIKIPTVWNVQINFTVKFSTDLDLNIGNENASSSNRLSSKRTNGGHRKGDWEVLPEI